MEADMQISISTSNGSPNVPLAPGVGGLEAVYEDICRGRIASGLEDLFDDLSVRREDAPEAWPEFARACLDHPLRRLLHQDPFTYRAFSKPRGYAGDAVMMDYIYGLGETSRRPAAPRPSAARSFAHVDSAVGASRPVSAEPARGPDRQLAVPRRRRGVRACGRTSPGSGAVRRRSERSDSGVRRHGPGHGKPGGRCPRLRALRRQAVSGSVRQILSGKAQPGEFDFVYAAGLFDYLGAPVAAALARSCST